MTELMIEELTAAGGKYVKPIEKEGFVIYQIQRNDTLGRIAKRFGLKSYREILLWNPKITNPNLIFSRRLPVHQSMTQKSVTAKCHRLFLCDHPRTCGEKRSAAHASHSQRGSPPAHAGKSKLRIRNSRTF